MTVSSREKAMAAVTVMALLYGVLLLTLRGRLDAIRLLRAEQIEQRNLLAQREQLIAERGQWEAQYADLQDLMPVFEPDRRVDTYWLGVMDRLAAANELSIVKRQVGSERQVGDVFEMPIDCREWEGSLEAFVGFLYGLQAEGAMLDIRQLFVKPAPNKPAMLRGSFALHCAYLRQEAPPEEAAP